MSTDYKGMDPAVALQDFMQRVKEYERVYEELSDDEDDGNVSYIKVGATASSMARIMTHLRSWGMSTGVQCGPEGYHTEYHRLHPEPDRFFPPGTE
jgi:hypothetical protein